MGLDNENLADLPKQYKTDSVTNFVSVSKPTALATGDTWYKPSDGSKWYWNGSYWLSTELVFLNSDYKEVALTSDANFWGTAFSGRDIGAARSGIYFICASNAFYCSNATNGVDFWSLDFYALYTDGSLELLASNSTAFKPGAAWLETRTNINSPKSSLTKTVLLLYATATKNGTPSSIFLMSSVTCRWVHP